MTKKQHEHLTKDNDLSKTEESLAVVAAMTDALGANANDMDTYFTDDFRWMGNYGCGTKPGLEAFRNNWQLPLRAAFTERTYCDEARVAQGEWVSALGFIEATHSGEFMGIPATGKRVIIKYMDFWHVKQKRIADNWVSVDFPYLLAQLGVDVFNGEGWEAFDNGKKTPPKP